MSENLPDNDTVDVNRFELPLVEGVVVSELDGRGRMPTARQLETLHQQAYTDGFDAGRTAGYDAGKKLATTELERQIALLDGIMRDLSTPLAELDDELVRAVGELALLIARHLIRRELKADPGEVVAVVRETIRQLPVASRSTSIHLNPDDIELVQSALALGDDGRTWRLEPDPLIARGGCMVESESSRVDATVESRLAAIASRMFGGEREGDRD